MAGTNIALGDSRDDDQREVDHGPNGASPPLLSHFQDLHLLAGVASMRYALSALLVLFRVGVLCADSPSANLPTEQPRLKTIYSSLHGLEELLGKNRGLVLVFLGTECPVARQYAPRLNELGREFASQRISFVAVFPDVGTDVFTMATYAAEQDLAFPVVKDVDHRLADLMQVETTPEVVLLDGKLDKKYQGAIDNQFQRHGRKAAPSEKYLADAIHALLADKPIERAHVPPSGCPLERDAPKRKIRATTFHKDVAPLVQKHCQECHREGGVGPFELVSYDDVALNSQKIREVVADRRMPPWHGVLNPQFGTLAHSQQLSSEELATLLDWIDAGSPEGDSADAPPPIQRPSPQAWQIGKPDFVYRMPEPFHVPKSGTLEYQFFRVPLGLKEDRWFRAVEIKPGNAEVVHHVTLHMAPSTSGDRRFDGLATMAQLYGLTGERAKVLSDYVPGDVDNAKVYPADQAVLIPRNSDLIFEVHYTPNGRSDIRDQSMAAFVWAKEPPEHQVHTKIFRKAIGGFRIPPHEPHYRVEDTYYFEHDVEIDSIRPHFHLRGKSYRLEIIERDPQTDEIVGRTPVLTVPIYDPAWQRTYELATPLKLPAGSELLATGHFDNSRFNPNNPDPSATVLWGQQMSDEMFSTRFRYRLAPQAGQ
jgi:thiol-disulfide isomerase/thioredoxin